MASLTDKDIQSIVDSISSFSNFQVQYNSNQCFRISVNNRYSDYQKEKESADSVVDPLETPNVINPTNNSIQDGLTNFNAQNSYTSAAYIVFKNYLDGAKSDLSNCLNQQSARNASDVAQTLSNPNQSLVSQNLNYQSSPFDRRLDRLFIDSKDSAKFIKTPMSTLFMEPGTSGFIISNKSIEDSVKNANDLKIFKNKASDDRNKMLNDSFYQGVPALVNDYAIVKLYGSEGGQKLVNRKGERRWYEIDSVLGQSNAVNYSSVPTTSSLISWGNGDPYGRTPYSFSDFVFCKWWKKIENNRLITLRRFAAPIYDNMKFPGMDGQTNGGSGAKSQGNDKVPTSPTNPDMGSFGKITFPPMATALTYFGEETGNSLNSMLKFSTGVLWEDVQANVWEVNSNSTPDNKQGPGALFGTLTSFATMLNVGVGNFDAKSKMNSGVLPPDPYKEGPYENRIIGPVNRIDTVKKRKPGMDFKMDGLNIVFEYIGRPVGGINPKAALLDILSNFLVLGSANAVFFGGQHRFMANPAVYPFLGGAKGIEQWYNGNPIGWAKTTGEQFTGNAKSVGSGLFADAKSFFSTLFGGGSGGGVIGAIEGLFTGKGPAGNYTKNFLASKTAGTIPYLTGLKAMLTGEPVGDWHVTIGNPLNPIAMIGNLICEGVDVEFGEELGPDDFPTEMKFTIKLKHGMPRDRDAIQSIFNRGMGRIYDLPDSFVGTSDGQTHVDNATKNNALTGIMPNGAFGIVSSGASYRQLGPSGAKDNVLHSNISVWNRSSFIAGVSPNLEEDGVITSQIFQSAYRSSDWVALRSLQ